MQIVALVSLMVCTLGAILGAQEAPTGKNVDCKKEIRETNQRSRLEQLVEVCAKNRKELDAKIQPLRREQESLQAQREADELATLRAAGIGDRLAIPIFPSPRDPLE